MVRYIGLWGCAANFTLACHRAVDLTSGPASTCIFAFRSYFFAWCHPQNFPAMLRFSTSAGDSAVFAQIIDVGVGGNRNTGGGTVAAIAGEYRVTGISDRVRSVTRE